MADFPSMNMQQRTSQAQKQVQTQTQKLSQQQLLSIKLLAMGNQDLRQEIYSTVSKNPALVITKDSVLDGVKNVTVKGSFSDNTKIGSVTAAKKQESDNFQAALEATPDNSETLNDHLEQQFRLFSLPQSQEKLGLKLIWNLDEKGHHILAPVSLLDKKDLSQTPELLEKTIGIINQLDPVGTCVKDFEESLFVQAKLNPSAPDAALFILNGHFDFLNPPVPAKVVKKIKEYNSKNLTEILEKKSLDFSEEDIEQAIEFIKTLDPFPARDFSQSLNRFITPDVYVEKDRETGELTVKVSDETLPVVEIAKDFNLLSKDRTRVTKSTEASEKKRSEHRFVMDSVRSAVEFLESIQFRQKTLLLACQQIVSYQKEFFEKGQRYLKPLRQKDIAEKIGVHEATVSRMANEKYLKCDQGMFEISFFFTNAAGNSEENSDIPSSKTGIMYELEQILKEHAGDKKPLSDQKLSDILAERGITIARRTVAKYRSQLNIDSSYTR